MRSGAEQLLAISALRSIVDRDQGAPCL